MTEDEFVKNYYDSINTTKAKKPINTANITLEKAIKRFSSYSMKDEDIKKLDKDLKDFYG